MASSDAQGNQAFDDGGNELKGEFDFEVQFDSIDTLQFRTACCCCVCAADDCQDIMTVQMQRNCLCIQEQGSCKCFQCTDESGESLACQQGSAQCKCCSLTDADKNCVMLMAGSKGAGLCCLVGTGICQMCDPCDVPSTCLKSMAQVFCLHIRCALPCDEDVPFEIACCGAHIAGAEPNA